MATIAIPRRPSWATNPSAINFVRKANERRQRRVSTPFILHQDIINIVNTSSVPVMSFSSQDIEYTLNFNTQKFMDHIQKFDRMFKVEGYKEYFKIEYQPAKNLFGKTLSSLLLLDYDGISSELTYESSFFYTLKKDNLSLYFEQFIDEDNSTDNPEINLTVFRNKDLIFTDSGTMPQLILKINNDLDGFLNDDILVKANELPF